MGGSTPDDAADAVAIPLANPIRSSGRWTIWLDGVWWRTERSGGVLLLRCSLVPPRPRKRSVSNARNGRLCAGGVVEIEIDESDSID